MKYTVGDYPSPNENFFVLLVRKESEPKEEGQKALSFFVVVKCLFLFIWLCWVLGFPGGTQFSSVQLLSCVWLFATTWTAAFQASLSITNSWSLLKLMFIELVMPSNHLLLCCCILPLPSIFLSIGVFSNKPVLHIRWPKYWSFSFSINPPNKYSGLISFRIDWFDLLAVEGSLKSFLQCHSSKASILWCSVFLWSHSHIHTWLLEKP